MVMKTGCDVLYRNVVLLFYIAVHKSMLLPGMLNANSDLCHLADSVRQW